MQAQGQIFKTLSRQFWKSNVYCRTFGFSMSNAFKWVQTSLVWCRSLMEKLSNFNCSKTGYAAGTVLHELWHVPCHLATIQIALCNTVAWGLQTWIINTDDFRLLHLYSHHLQLVPMSLRIKFGMITLIKWYLALFRILDMSYSI